MHMLTVGSQEKAISCERGISVSVRRGLQVRSKPTTNYTSSYTCTSHPVESNPVIKSHLASRNELLGLARCRFGHVTPQNLGSTKSAYSTEWYRHYLSGTNSTINPLTLSVHLCYVSSRALNASVNSADIIN